MLSRCGLTLARSDSDKLDRDWPPALEILNRSGQSPIVLICEHASNHLPLEYRNLGLDPEHINRHIAWDIGAAKVTRCLSELLDAPAFLSEYSRLLVDLNRPLGGEASMPVRSEATDIPGNLQLSLDERNRREQRMFVPFHDSVAQFLDERQRQRQETRIVAIHSFTPVFLGQHRPWHAGILFASAQEFGTRVISALRNVSQSMLVEPNVPYVIADDEDYAIPVHGDRRGNPAILVEIRNDLIDSQEGAACWARYLSTALAQAIS